MPNIDNPSFRKNNEEVDQRGQDNTGLGSDEYDSFMMNSEKIGAKVLAQVNFEDRHKDITDTSYEKALKRGEKIDSKPSERRSVAYIRRLKDMVDKYGSSVERKLWRQSAKRLIISADDIPDSYWEHQKQLLRDQGRGYYEIDEDEKELLTDNIRMAQQESLKLWSDYLGDEDCPFPMWFKVYAWDGMSKMGGFDREKKCFAKRDKHTVAPYPKLNPSALAKVYELILDFYGREHADSKAEDEIMDDELQSLVVSGNFNKLYSKILLSEKRSIETPKDPDDIIGEWVEYLPGDEEKLAEAAQNTPWCISDPYMGREYLRPQDAHGENKAKFILFHLIDPATGLPSESACASIRLNADGMVTEISGLGVGQVLENALSPTVSEKLKTLPGGEKFLESFADNNMLISLDRKMKNGEELTREEFDFIYEINRPIKTLRRYGDDPRIKELRSYYGITRALGAGVEPRKLIQHISGREIISNLPMLIDSGASIDYIVSTLSPSFICGNIDKLNQYGANIDIKDLVPKLSPRDTLDNLGTLIEHDVLINFTELINNLDGDSVEQYRDLLVSCGASMQDIATKLGKSVHECLNDMNRDFACDHIKEIIDGGVDINYLIRYLGSDYVGYWRDVLSVILDHNPNLDLLLSVMSNVDKSLQLKTLLDRGISVERILPHLNGFIVSQDDNCKLLIEHGANIDDIAEVITNKRVLLYEAVKVLAENGADLRKIISRVDKHDKRVLELLRQYGIEI